MKNKESPTLKDAWNSIRKSFNEFLMVPTIIILSFLLLAFITSELDHARLQWLEPFRQFMKHHIFSSPKGTSSLLGAIGGSLITVSSLTITLLLLVVQQSAATMTTRVFDQFMRNKINQSYFGFFVGLALYSLIILATVAPSFNPIIGASFTLLLTVFALYFLIVLIYTTINEMRPPVIIEAIFQNILKARKNEDSLLNKTRRSSVVQGQLTQRVTSDIYGYVASINVEKLNKTLKETSGQSEVVYDVSVGDYIAVHDVFASVKGQSNEDCKKLCKAVVKATEIQKQRKSVNDPGDTIEQLQIIAWTSVSTAKSDPYPGLLTIRAIRNLISVWEDVDVKENKNPANIVYNVYSKSLLFNCLETLGIVASESMQHMVFTEVFETFIDLFDRLTFEEKDRVEDITNRILSCMGDFVLTRGMEDTLEQFAEVLKNNNRAATAASVSAAKNKLKESTGELNSRATRTGK